MSARRGRRGSRGQAIVELGLSLPVMVFLALGAADFGRAYFYRLPVSAAASAGARIGAVSVSGDIGLTVRTQSSAMPNNSNTWGLAATTDADCSTATSACGDPNGCTTVSSFWTTPASSGQPNPVACFAVRSCTVDISGSGHDGSCSTEGVGVCTASSGWWTRPGAGAAQGSPNCLGALQVTVTYRLVPVTPLIGTFFSGPNNSLFLTSTATVMEEY